MATTKRYPISYYPLQIMLAVCGIALGLFVYGVLDSLGLFGFGKPHVFLFILTVAIPPIILVRIHRMIATNQFGDRSNNNSNK